MVAGLGKVAICNMALGFIGDRTITDLSEATEEARKCDLFYDIARTQALEAHDWNFARRRQELALSGGTPPIEWTYEYLRPADLIKARRIQHPLGHEADAIAFEMGMDSTGKLPVVYMDEQTPVLVYTWNQEDVEVFTTHFVLLLATVLASYIVGPLTRDAKKITEATNKARTALLTAPAMDASEGVEKAPREAEAIRARA